MSFNVILDQGIDLSVRANLEIQFWMVNFPLTPTFKAGAGAVSGTGCHLATVSGHQDFD